MKIRKVITPNFYKKFRCTGAECLNDCCYGWNIFIDKRTYTKYINSSDSEIRDIARNKLKLTRQGKGKHSVIQFDENKRCPFFTEDKLCKIHQKMGGESLSTVCATYPRLKDAWGDQLRHNMTLSCPKVARLVLFDRDSMLQHEEINLIASSAKSFTSSGQTLAQKDKLIHLFACYLINAESNDIEANLLALAQFILYLQRINFDVAGQLSEIEAFYESLVVALREGQLTMDNSGKKEALQLKIRAIMAIFSGNIQGTVRNSALRDVGASIFSYLGVPENAEVINVNEKFTGINQQWRQLCATSCLAEPHVLRNYLHYQLYTSCFPGRDISQIMRIYYRIVMDYFFLKLSFSIKSLHQEIKQEDVMQLIADYHQYINHTLHMKDKLDQAINKINGGDDLSCLLLLG